MINYPRKNKRILRRLVEKGIKHTKEIGSISTTVKYETLNKDGTTKKNVINFTDKPMDMATLGFISKVKADVKRELQKLQIFEPIKHGQTRYYKHNHVESASDIIEIDVNGAYWKIAYNKGYISKKLYDFGLTVPKKRRLIGLGALASSKGVYLFDGNEYNFKENKVNPLLRSVFFDISFELDSMMLNLLNEVPYLFYWVDAIFCKQEYKEQVESYFDDFDLDVKINDYTKLKRYKKSFVVINEKTGDEKLFFIPSKKKAKEIKDLAYINYLENGR